MDPEAAHRMEEMFCYKSSWLARVIKFPTHFFFSKNDPYMYLIMVLYNFHLEIWGLVYH